MWKRDTPWEKRKLELLETTPKTTSRLPTVTVQGPTRASCPAGSARGCTRRVDALTLAPLPLVESSRWWNQKPVQDSGLRGLLSIFSFPAVTLGDTVEAGGNGNQMRRPTAPATQHLQARRASGVMGMVLTVTRRADLL